MTGLRVGEWEWGGGGVTERAGAGSHVRDTRDSCVTSDGGVTISGCPGSSYSGGGGDLARWGRAGPR